MATRNDITGDSITTKNISESYRSNYDLIFGKNKSTTCTTKENNATDRKVEAGPTGSQESS